MGPHDQCPFVPRMTLPRIWLRAAKILTPNAVEVPPLMVSGAGAGTFLKTPYNLPVAVQWLHKLTLSIDLWVAAVSSRQPPNGKRCTTPRSDGGPALSLSSIERGRCSGARVSSWCSLPAHEPSRFRRSKQRRKQRNARQHDDRRAQTNAGGDGANDDRSDKEARVARGGGGGDADRRR